MTARPLDGVNVGDELPALARVVTADDVRAYAGASGDLNPLHQDDAVARAAGFPGIIAHGMFTMGHLATAVVAWAGDADAVTSITSQFRAPVAMGETITAGGRVTSVDLRLAHGDARPVGHARARRRHRVPGPQGPGGRAAGLILRRCRGGSRPTSRGSRRTSGRPRSAGRRRRLRRRGSTAGRACPTAARRSSTSPRPAPGPLGGAGPTSPGTAGPSCPPSRSPCRPRAP